MYVVLAERKLFMKIMSVPYGPYASIEEAETARERLASLLEPFGDLVLVVRELCATDGSIAVAPVPVPHVCAPPVVIHPQPYYPQWPYPLLPYPQPGWLNPTVTYNVSGVAGPNRSGAATGDAA